MILIDTNGISFLIEQNLEPLEDCFMSPDVKNEVEMTQLVHGGATPANIMELNKHLDFDESIYLNHYRKMLNKHGGRSFYNMTGFGDISILSSIHMLLEVYRNRRIVQLFDFSQDIAVYSNDGGLKGRVGLEFVRESVAVHRIEDLPLKN